HPRYTLSPYTTLFRSARVVRNDGDQTFFSYRVDPFFEPSFGLFLRQYHRVNPLEETEVLFLKEAYRFFILNYVVRSGEHFFRPADRKSTRLNSSHVKI